MGEDESLDGGEPVEDESAGGVGGVQVGEGGQYGTGGGDGVAVFGQDAWQRDVGAERGAQVGFDESVDEQGDADDGDRGRGCGRRCAGRPGARAGFV